MLSKDKIVQASPIFFAVNKYLKFFYRGIYDLLFKIAEKFKS